MDFLPIGESDFSSQVLASTVPALVEFGGLFCRPCKTLEPLLLRFSAQYFDRVRLFKVQVEEAPDLAVRWNIFSLPTTILFVQGEPKAVLTGLQPFERIQATFAPFI